MRSFMPATGFDSASCRIRKDICTSLSTARAGNGNLFIRLREATKPSLCLDRSI